MSAKVPCEVPWLRKQRHWQGLKTFIPAVRGVNRLAMHASFCNVKKYM